MDLIDIDKRELHDIRKIIAITKSEGSISKKFIYKIGKLNCRLIVVKTSKIVQSDSNILIDIFNLIVKMTSGYIIFYKRPLSRWSYRNNSKF